MPTPNSPRRRIPQTGFTSSNSLISTFEQFFETHYGCITALFVTRMLKYSIERVPHRNYPLFKTCSDFQFFYIFYRPAGTLIKFILRQSSITLSIYQKK